MTEPMFAEVLVIEPGKTYVIECDWVLSSAEAQRIREQWTAASPESKLLILSGGMKIARDETLEVDQ